VPKYGKSTVQHCPHLLDWVTARREGIELRRASLRTELAPLRKGHVVLKLKGQISFPSSKSPILNLGFLQVQADP
jgi:hypothetical protein